jgi:Tfp pilus assembly protein PilF
MATSRNKSDGGPNREELLQMAIQAAKTGQKDGARMMFRQVLEADRRNERAMMWLAKLADNKEERVQWLQKALEVNPENTAARQTLNAIKYKRAASEGRTLFLFGVIVAILVVVLLVFVLLLATGAVGG